MNSKFAKLIKSCRDPNSELSPKPRWDAVSSSELEYLHINTVADIMGKKLLRDRYEFWDRLPLMGSSEKQEKQTEFNEEAQIMLDEVKVASKHEPEKESTILPEKDEL